MIGSTDMTTLQLISLDWKIGKSEIDPATIEAYRSTHYTVLTPELFVLRVGETSSRLADLLANENASCAAFLTAWNPFSNIATDAENLATQQALSIELADLGRLIVPGFGKDPSGI